MSDKEIRYEHVSFAKSNSDNTVIFTLNVRKNVDTQMKEFMIGVM